MTNGNELLTDYERTKLENFALKHNTLQQQIQANLQARYAFIQIIESEHPDYHWQDPEGLIKTIPDPGGEAVNSQPVTP